MYTNSCYGSFKTYERGHKSGPRLVNMMQTEQNNACGNDPFQRSSPKSRISMSKILSQFLEILILKHVKEILSPHCSMMLTYYPIYFNSSLLALRFSLALPPSVPFSRLCPLMSLACVCIIGPGLSLANTTYSLYRYLPYTLTV